MKFLNRQDEISRLSSLAKRPGGGLAVVFGRRRIGKTRLLVEWCQQHNGVYVVADQSAADIQRRYLAEAFAVRFPGFSDVEYRDWSILLSRIAETARLAAWHGPIVFDELPYWTASSPELPSVLQRWIDHEARSAGLVVAVAGSSQRMMQGLALSREAPLYGRAAELFEVPPLEISEATRAIGRSTPMDLIEFYTAWGGVPRYWELAADLESDTRRAIEHLVLDPRGPLHREPDRLLLEEVPSALEVRPILDAVGAGAHRVSEIAGRLGRPATSLSRPIDRLIELGLASRDVPFGESPRTSRRSLYRIADPFTRLWFRVVAPHRGELVSGTPNSRIALLDRHWSGLVAQSWEQLCRHRLPHTTHPLLGQPGAWKPAGRWWSGNLPEWDIVAEDVDGKRILLGEAKLASGDLQSLASEVEARPAPELPSKFRRHTVLRAVFTPEGSRMNQMNGTCIVGLRHMLKG